VVGELVMVEERERDSQDPEPALELKVEDCGVVVVLVDAGENGDPASPNAAEKALESAELRRLVGGGGGGGTATLACSARSALPPIPTPILELLPFVPPELLDSDRL